MHALSDAYMRENVYDVVFSSECSDRQECLSDGVLDLLYREGLSLAVSLDDCDFCAAHNMVVGNGYSYADC